MERKIHECVLEVVGKLGLNPAQSMFLAEQTQRELEGEITDARMNRLMEAYERADWKLRAHLLSQIEHELRNHPDLHYIIDAVCFITTGMRANPSEMDENGEVAFRAGAFAGRLLREQGGRIAAVDETGRAYLKGICVCALESLKKPLEPRAKAGLVRIAVGAVIGLKNCVKIEEKLLFWEAVGRLSAIEGEADLFANEALRGICDIAREHGCAFGMPKNRKVKELVENWVVQMLRRAGTTKNGDLASNIGNAVRAFVVMGFELGGVAEKLQELEIAELAGIKRGLPEESIAHDLVRKAYDEKVGTSEKRRIGMLRRFFGGKRTGGIVGRAAVLI